MDFQLCCGSSHPQIWAIEALACSNHVEPSLLLDLLKKTPKNSNHIGKNAWELVSLRFLESLFTQGARTNPASSSLSKTMRLDPSDHCEDVLRRILNEISLSPLKPAGLEISKWDLEPFIEHKKSNLPTYALKQLKDAILTGNHSIWSLLKEQSGLLVGCHTQDQAPTKDGTCVGIIPAVEGSDTDDGNLISTDIPDASLVAVNKRRRASASPAEQLCTTHINPIKKNKNDVISNEYVGEQLISSGVNIQISDTSTVAVQNVEGKRFFLETKMNDGNMGLLEPSNDINECTSSRLGEHNKVLPCGKQVSHCDTELNDKSEEQLRQDQRMKDGGKNEICDLKKSNENMDEVEESVHVTDDNDGNDDKKNTARKEISSLSPHCTNNQDSQETANSRDQSVLADTSERWSLEEETCVEVVRQTGSLGGGKDQCNSSKGLVGNVHIPHCGTEVLKEKLDVAMQNCKSKNTENRRKSSHGLISSNEDIDKFDQNVPRTMSTVGEAEDVIISCDNDGYYDERTTIDTKKKTFLSSQGTYSEDSLTRTDLGELHLCMKCNKGGNVLLSCASDSCPIVIHQICLSSDESLDARELFYCPFCAYSQAISKYMEVKKYASLARQNLTTFICFRAQKESSQQPWNSRRIDGNCLKQNDGLPKDHELNQTNGLEKVSNHQCSKKLEFEHAGRSALYSDYCPPFGRKDAVSTGTLVQSSKGDKQDVRRMSEESESPRVHKQQPIAAEAVHNSQRETAFHQDSETSASEKHGDIRSEKGVPHPPETDLPYERKCSQSPQSTDAEEISEYENEDTGASKYFVKVRKQERKNSYPAFPQMRRKRLRWTKTEEDVLTEGMRVHCSPNRRVIPWKKILEHGEAKFQPGRSTMDLKDKWRNMCKGSPKSK